MHEPKASVLHNRDCYCVIQVHHIKTCNLAKFIIKNLLLITSPAALIKPIPNLCDLFLNLFLVQYTRYGRLCGNIMAVSSTDRFAEPVSDTDEVVAHTGAVAGNNKSTTSGASAYGKSGLAAMRLWLSQTELYHRQLNFWRWLLPTSRTGRGNSFSKFIKKMPTYIFIWSRVLLQTIENGVFTVNPLKTTDAHLG